MSIAIFNDVKITGMACTVPATQNRLSDYCDTLGGNDIKKFVDVTGVKSRHIVKSKQTCSDLCYVAAERLLEYKGYDKQSIDGLVFVTQSPDYVTPATSHILQYRLGLSKDCMVFDINLGCSGFVYGLNIVASMIQSGALHRVLFCCGEAHLNSHIKIEHTEDVLFGDAGTVTLVEPGDECIHTLLKADGQGYQAIMTIGLSPRIDLIPEEIDAKTVKNFSKCRMDGGAVFEFAITQVPRSFKEFFKTFGGSIEDYDYCVFHQANLFMLKHIAKKIKLPLKKMPVSMDRYGNTSSASIPLTIADLCQREDCKDTIRFITSGFGIGLSWGIADFTMEKKDILPIIETDDYFEDAYTG